MKDKKNVPVKKISKTPIILAFLFATLGIGASVKAFELYFEENPLPVDFLLFESESDEAEEESEFDIVQTLADASVYLAQGDFTSAEKKYRNILNADAGNETAQSGLLRVYESRILENIQSAEYDEAWKDMEELRSMDESCADLLQDTLTDAMNKDAKTQEDAAAKALYDKILSYDKENIDACEGLILLALKAQDYDTASNLIKENSDLSDSDRLLRFRSSLPFSLAADQNFGQLQDLTDFADYPVMLFDTDYHVLTEDEEVYTVREPMVTEITDFSKTLPDENGDVIYSITLHHKANVSVMIAAGSKFVQTGVGFLVSGPFPLFYDYYTGTMIPFSQDDEILETILTWNGRDSYVYTDSWGIDQTDDTGTFTLDGDKYVRRVSYEYTRTATVKVPEDYDGLCLAFPKVFASTDSTQTLNENTYVFVRAAECEKLRINQDDTPVRPDSASESEVPSSASKPSQPSQNQNSKPSSDSGQASSAVPSSTVPSESIPPSVPESSSEPEQSSIPESSAPPEQSSEQATPAPAEVSTDSYTDDVVNLVNLERSNAGLGSVSATSELNAAAAARANEIIESFSHTRPDGTSCFTILAPYGISYSTAGENIAAGQSSPESVMDAWMNSEGHRANILNGSFNHIGVGFVKIDSGYRYYWVQLFTD